MVKVVKVWFLFKRFGPEGSKLARESAAAAASSTADDDEAQCLGERTREERDAEGRAEAVDLE